MSGDPSEDSVIEFESVTKRYRDGTTAVRDLSLRIPSDQITVLVGPSGCGKTTTLRMINRMLEPTSGTISWDGKAMKSQRRTRLRRQMGYVIQSGGLFPHRTVLENIQTVPGLLGWEKAKNRKRALEVLELVGLDRNLAFRYPAQLSGGQQQRVGVARALAADPLVLLMDEPFSAVDPVVRAELQDQFLELQQQLAKTIVLITHDVDEAIKLGDQVAILRVGGELAQIGTPQQLLDEPADDFVSGFVGKDRGYRGLSFVSASGLELDRVQAVRDPASAAAGEPTLVIDGDAKPIGWVDHDRPGNLLDLGATFDPATDTMRAALDSALTSPVGLAVAVASNGRYSGVVTAGEILDQVTAIRASIADDISERTGGRAADDAAAADDTTAADESGVAESAAPGADAPGEDPQVGDSAAEGAPADGVAVGQDAAPEESGFDEPSGPVNGDLPPEEHTDTDARAEHAIVDEPPVDEPTADEPTADEPTAAGPTLRPALLDDPAGSGVASSASTPRHSEDDEHTEIRPR